MAGAKALFVVGIWKDPSRVVGSAWTLRPFHNLGRIIQFQDDPENLSLCRCTRIIGLLGYSN